MELKHRDTPEKWRASRSANALVVSPPEDDRVSWIGLLPEDEVPCSSLLLQPTATFGEEPDGGHVIDATAPVAISEEPNGPAIARVQTGGLVGVEILSRRDRALEISIQLPNASYQGARIVGWVDESLVIVGERDISLGIGDSGRGMSGSSDWGGCRGPHPLLVSVGAQHERVGTVLPGTRVEVLERVGNSFMVSVLGPALRENPSPIKLLPDAEFVLSQQDAEDCQ